MFTQKVDARDPDIKGIVRLPFSVGQASADIPLSFETRPFII